MIPGIFVNGKLTYKKEIMVSKFVVYVSTLFKFPKTSITINFVNPMTLSGQEKKDLIKYLAWMERVGRREFILTINSTLLSNMEDALQSIGHELTHAKQYLKGELIDLKDGSVKYKGKIYTNWEYGEGYWFAPWEIESYGMELGLYECFMESNESNRTTKAKKKSKLSR